MFFFLNYLSFVFLKVHVLNIVKLKEENHTSSHFALHNRNYIFFNINSSDGTQSFGTSLVFYEKLSMSSFNSIFHVELNGQFCYNKYNQELFIPKALCVLSVKPFFSCHTAFLKYIHIVIFKIDVYLKKQLSIKIKKKRKKFN